MPTSDNADRGKKSPSDKRPHGKRPMGHLIAMLLITMFAVALMIASVSKGRGEIEEAEIVNLDAQPASVKLMTVQPAPLEITDRYSGTIRPFERFLFSFENNGRVIELGSNDREESLDDGDRVTAGQALAFLDAETLSARQEELNAALEFSEEEYQRALDLQAENSRAINEAEVLKRNKDRLVALARIKQLEKQLEDATLRSTVDGVISKRFINAGEIVTMQSPAFEVIQVDQVLLVVGVPESRIRRIPRPSKQSAADHRESNSASTNVYVRLIGSGQFGSDDQGLLKGTVYRIGQTSDRNSGLFEVEILLDNKSGDLRPGMIAIANIVVDELEGFEIPLSATVVRNDQMYVFAATNEVESERLVAKRFEIAPGNYEIQDDSAIIREIPSEFRRVVTSGQHRLVDGRTLTEVLAEERGKESTDQGPNAADENLANDSDIESDPVSIK